MREAPIIGTEQRKLPAQILRQILKAPLQKVWISGSGVTGKARANSDLDLLFDPALTLADRARLNEAFEESALPYAVDLVNRDDLADEYRSMVELNKVVFDYFSGGAG